VWYVQRGNRSASLLSRHTQDRASVNEQNSAEATASDRTSQNSAKTAPDRERGENTERGSQAGPDMTSR
jgi:hypothetical protein